MLEIVKFEIFHVCLLYIYMYVYPIILHVVTKFLSRKQSDLYGSAIKRGDRTTESGNSIFP